MDFPDTIALHLGQTKWNGRDAAERNADVVDHTPDCTAAKPPQRGYTDFRNGLSIASADFAGVVKILRKFSPKTDGANQFVGLQLHLLVAGVEADVRNTAFAPHRRQNQFRFVDQQRRQGIGGGRGIRYITSERSAILVCDSSGPPGGARQQWKLLCDHDRAHAARCKYIPRRS